MPVTVDRIPFCEPYDLPLLVDYVSSYDGGSLSTWYEPGDGPDAEVEVWHVYFKRPDGVLVELTLPPDVLDAIAKEIREWILEANAP